MALFKRFEWVILNDLGEPVSGCSVEVRKQGATANASGQLTTVDVHHVGALIAGDTIVVDTNTSPTRTVVSVAGPTAPQVVLSGIGHIVTNDVSRLSCNTPITVYNDVDGVETKTNALTTDANGLAFCYAPYDFVDAVVALTAAGSAPHGPASLKYIPDWPGTGAGTNNSSIIDSNAAATAYVDDTVRALTNAASKIRSFRVNGVEKAFIDKDGKLNAGSGGVTTSASIVTTGSGTITSAGLLMASNGFTVSSGTVTLPNGSLATAYLANNAVHPAPSTTTGGAASVGLSTSEVVRITTSYTPTSGNVGVLITYNAQYDLQINASSTVRIEARLYVGGTEKERGMYRCLVGSAGSIGGGSNISFSWIEPAMAASPTTIEVRDIYIVEAGSIIATNYRGDIKPGHLVIQEFKK